ncbi:MobH family relaxase [Delftia lacustris]|uniref:MobH family relaxase n=1 Tax=Delftia lacustris TaxID=558537 RepID=UPI0035A58B34
MPAAAPPISISGKEQGWLRVLPANELIRLVQAQKAVRQMWHQSRLAEVVFQRDLLPAIHRYAEYVQLMPASEAHHHAHAGGLLAHTLEMVLAAMTWRNAHFLPTNAPVEQIDAERDQWTYVVFFAALLHDIAKPMTDLRILWRGGTMNEPIRWKPIAGSLSEVGDGRPDMEYRVEFEPKTARDYQAHSRLALTLLGQIAPSSALTFLARTPHAFDALSQYLSGNKSGLLADIVKRADQASTSNALLKGSKARFGTANAVPLVDLLMQALKSMLHAGTELPLNRSGAAGWVHDGSIWFVAKRLADTTRAWIKTHAPDEAIPGEAKNDRLFDTWQEYGILQVNPQTGQAIWHVEVIGEVLPQAQEGAAQEEGSGQEEGAGAGQQYSHALSMLRFPLDKLYDDASLYPPAMAGKIIVKAKRDSAEPEDAQASPDEDQAESAVSVSKNAAASASGPAKPKPAGASKFNKAQAVPEPKFNKPKLPQQSAPKAPAQGKPEPVAVSSAATSPKNAAIAAPASPRPQKPRDSSSYRGEPVFPPLEEAVDGFGMDDDSFLDEDDSASRVAAKPKPPTVPRQDRIERREPETVGRAAVTPGRPKNAAIAAPQSPRKAPDPGATTTPKEAVQGNFQETAAGSQAPDYVKSEKSSKSGALPPLTAMASEQSGTPPEPQAARSNRLFSKPSTPTSGGTTPVVLTPALPDLPHEVAARKKEPSATAMEFIEWLQRGLASREIKYNETGAPVHFVSEGMALVSPFIFKLYARETGPEEQADATGMQVQREVIKAGWHRMGPGSGKGKVNILCYQVIGRGNAVVARLSAVVLVDPDRFVLPVPPPNPVLKLEGE